MSFRQRWAGAAPQRSRTDHKPTLVVIDDAASRAEQLRDWLGELVDAQTTGRPSLRILLLERQIGWLAAVFGHGQDDASRAVRALLDPPEPVALRVLDDPAIRRQIFSTLLRHSRVDLIPPGLGTDPVRSRATRREMVGRSAVPDDRRPRGRRPHLRISSVDDVRDFVHARGGTIRHGAAVTPDEVQSISLVCWFCRTELERFCKPPGSARKQPDLNGAGLRNPMRYFNGLARNPIGYRYTIPQRISE